MTKDYDDVDIPNADGIFDDDCDEFGFNDVFDRFDLSDDDCYGCVGEDLLDLDSIKIRLNILGYPEDMTDRDLLFNIVHFLNKLNSRLESPEFTSIPEYSKIPFDPRRDERNKKRLDLMKKMFRTSIFLARVCKMKPEFVPLVVDNIHSDVEYRLKWLKDEIIENYLKNSIPD